MRVTKLRERFLLLRSTQVANPKLLLLLLLLLLLFVLKKKPQYVTLYPRHVTLYPRHVTLYPLPSTKTQTPQESRSYHNIRSDFTFSALDFHVYCHATFDVNKPRTFGHSVPKQPHVYKLRVAISSSRYYIIQNVKAEE